MRGSPLIQTGHAHPSDGTPTEVPVPRRIISPGNLMVRTDFFKLGHLSKGFEQNASVVEFVTRVSGIQETGIERRLSGSRPSGLSSGHYVGGRFSLQPDRRAFRGPHDRATRSRILPSRQWFRNFHADYWPKQDVACARTDRTSAGTLSKPIYGEWSRETTLTQNTQRYKLSMHKN